MGELSEGFESPRDWEGRLQGIGGIFITFKEFHPKITPFSMKD